MGRGDPEFARRINTALILDQLREDKKVSRAHLSRRLRLSKMTVSTIVRELIKAGLVDENGVGESQRGGGRRPILLTLDRRYRLILGIDIGTTNTALRVADVNGDEVLRLRVSTRKKHDVESVTLQVRELVNEAMRKLRSRKSCVAGTGLSVAGIVESSSGLILRSPDMGWENVNIKAILEKSLNLPLRVDNCTRAMALGEQRYGLAKGTRNVLYVNVGYGIGSALVFNGRIYDRKSELGHTYVTRQRIRCHCGKYGCLEAVASGHAIEQKANHDLRKSKGHWLTAEEVARMAADGDAAAAAIFAEAGKFLGKAISFAANILSPDKVIIGGGISLAGGLLLEPVRREFNRHTMTEVRKSTEIAISCLGMEAGVLGAVALGLDKFVFDVECLQQVERDQVT